VSRFYKKPLGKYFVYQVAFLFFDRMETLSLIIISQLTQPKILALRSIASKDVFILKNLK